MLPKEGSSFNIDCMAIPADAPNPDNAHKFIDFILEARDHRGDHHCGRLRQRGAGLKAYIDKTILADPAVYPPAGAKTYLPPLPSPDYDRARNRLWTEIRAGG